MAIESDKFEELFLLITTAEVVRELAEGVGMGLLERFDRLSRCRAKAVQVFARHAAPAHCRLSLSILQ